MMSIKSIGTTNISMTDTEQSKEDASRRNISQDQLHVVCWVLSVHHDCVVPATVSFVAYVAATEIVVILVGHPQCQKDH
jgi:hypothetical protein